MKPAPIEVDIFRSGTTEVMGKLAAEISAGQPGADVLLIADAASMEILKSQKQLLAIPAPRPMASSPAPSTPTRPISARS